MEDITEKELRRQILIFLREFKELVNHGHLWTLGHLKNVKALNDLGITARIRDEIILSLGVENYSAGPRADEYKLGMYWVFGKALDTTEIYIKLKIVTDNHGSETAVCMSFHPTEYPMKYPLRS